MIRHLFKLIWNKKRKNALLIIEIALSFFVFFAVLSFAFFNFNNYLQPLGFDYERIWVVNMNWGDNGENATQLWEKKLQIENHLSGLKEIEEFAFSGNALPFAQTTNSSNLKRGEEINIQTSLFYTALNYDKTMNLNFVEGRWFQPEDFIGNDQPIVINQLTKDGAFPDGESALGKTVHYNGSDRKVIGVVDHFRSKHEFQEPPRVTFLPLIDSTFVPSCILMKMAEDADVNFEEKLMSDLSSISPTWSFEMEYLEEKRVIAGRIITIPLILMFTVCGFLIFNVALGLFGVLWYNINQRKPEIGLRRAAGASESMIARQFLGETWVLASIGIFIGAFFAIQFPILHVFDLSSSIYMLAILASMLLIYLLTSVCAYFPSKQASAIEPALALHEE